MYKKRATLKDVADHVGVHYSTVSRALNPSSSHLITDEVKARVREAVEQLGYRHNGAAVSLRTNTTKTIGVVVPDITNMLFPPIIRGIEDTISRKSYVAMIGNTDDDPERERLLIGAFLRRGIEGLIVASALREDPIISGLLAEGTPIVTVNSRVSDKRVSSVVNADREGIGALMRHLVDLGHRQIAYISGPTSWSTGRDRLASYLYWSKRLSIEADERLIVYSKAYRENEGEICAHRLLSGGAQFTAIVGANDLLAMGAISALEAHGKRCPDDISVTGFNDIPLSARWSPPLTTVQIQPYRAGQQAAEILLENILSPQTFRPQHFVLPATLVVRRSTARPSHQKSL